MKESTYVRFRRLCAALGVGLLALTGLLLLLSLHPTPALADPGTLFVAPDGTGTACTQGNPCSLQTALAQATDGDTIYVATGTYTGTGAAVITVTQSITLYGGWDGSPTGPVVRDPDAYPTTLDGENGRRVVYISGSITPTVDGFNITGGNADGLGGDYWEWDAGGGVYVITATATIRNNQVFSNIAERGGGLYLYTSPATLSGNTIISNSGERSAGGLFLYRSNATLSDNAVISNSTGGDGGGLYLSYSDNATLSSNIFDGNTAGAHGGGLYLYGSAVLSSNTIISNTANKRGGGLCLYSGNATLSGNTVASNTANEWGGGLFIYGASPTLVNNIIADNRANIAGSGLYIWTASPRLQHTTIARNSGGDASGVHVSHVTGSSTVVLDNTILVSHTVGITVTAGDSASLEATLWGSGAWANTTDWGGDGTILTGTVNIWGDPAFVDPDGGDYHIGPDSAAIDAGVDVGVTTDIDGEARPNGPGYDIGADEFYCYALTDVDITGPVTGTTGTAYVFTATVAPPTATLPITYTWSPQPDAGQSGPVVTYTWATAGTKAITVTAENCGGVVSDTHAITIWGYVYLPLVVRDYP